MREGRAWVWIRDRVKVRLKARSLQFHYICDRNNAGWNSWNIDLHHGASSTLPAGPNARDLDPIKTCAVNLIIS